MNLPQLGLALLIYNKNVPLCVVCQKNPARENMKTCSRECSQEYRKEYQKTDKYRAYQKEYQKTDKYRAYRKEYYLKNKELEK